MANTNKLQEDRSTLERGILDTPLNWATLENQMAMLLEAIMNRPGYMLGTEIYFAPGNSETRFDVVDRALRAIIQNAVEQAKIVTTWHHLIGKLHKAREQRNRITHGNISTAFIRGKNYVRLTPPIFDVTRMRKTIRPNQLPGMSPHDVASVAQRLGSLIEDVEIMKEIIEALNRNDVTTLQRKLRELKARQQAQRRS